MISIRKLISLFIILIPAVFIFLQNSDDISGKECDLSVENIKNFIPEANSMEQIDENCFFRVYDSADKDIATVLYANPGENYTAGFGGQMKVFVVLDDFGKIKGVFQGENNETGSYIDLLKRKGFYENWNGLGVKEAFNKDIDAVTGATMSSSAVGEMVRMNLDLYSGSKNFISHKRKFVPAHIVILIVFLFSLISFFIKKKAGKYRYLLLLLIVVAGFAGGTMASMEMFYNWLQNGVHGNAFPIFIIVVISMAVTLIMKKNLYCYYFCPMGALQEFFYKTPVPKLGIKPSIQRKMVTVRKIFLYIILVFMVLEVFEDYSVFEPFCIFRFKAAALSTLIIGVAALIFSIFIPKPWCRFFCPTGEVFDTLERCRKDHIPGSR